MLFIVFFPPRQKLVKCFHFCLQIGPGTPRKALCPPPLHFFPSLCFPPTPALALVFITPFLVFACRARPLPSLCTCPRLPKPPCTPFRVSCLSALLRSSLLSFFPPSPPSSLFSLSPFLLLLSLFQAESHSLLPMSLAFSSSCFHCHCMGGEPPCLSWSPSFVDFPFRIRTPFFPCVCLFLLRSSSRCVAPVASQSPEVGQRHGNPEGPGANKDRG